MVDEETALIGGGESKLGHRTLTLNIERIRFWGLIAGAVLLIVGKFVTMKFVVLRGDDVLGKPSTKYDKIFNGADSDFDNTQTFIYQMFLADHSCTYLDFNPAKTVAALLVMFHTIPFNIFVVCHYLRITGQSDPIFDSIKKFTVIASPIQFIFNAYFYMVFVNSPDGVYGTPEGMQSFIKHYVPYQTWQISMVLMAVQQCWYIALKNQIPFKCITPGMMMMYLKFLALILITYFAFVWSYILGIPLWDTETAAGLMALKIMMHTWSVCALVVPLIFSWFESADGNDTKIVFNELQ